MEGSVSDKVRVVIVDDNAGILVTLVRALKYRPGVEVVATAASFQDLSQIIGAAKPDVIVLDENMPGTKGSEGIKKLRASGITTPVILMSADDRVGGSLEAAGAAGFFYKEKPDFGALVEQVRRVAQPKAP